ncbi:uncharacterized protein DUF3987 [Gramella sp. Hel_I_59]|uniref:DUF3987 domain-containing protein n=1 Tax=Gramella sp. Hel_I_59 TaxID=1249978 RepID=UPI001154BD5F|nr:DUF3987 domain-containing protein [Gramella sp. Hel_I_59]TQI71422.1 uncharacterized protein DUF3987 [Gramella sp. Hel_I_59]
MGAEKQEASHTLRSIRGSNNLSENEFSKNTIDRLDLESDFLNLTEKNENQFPFDIFPKVLQEIIFEASNKYQFSIDYLGAGILSASSAAIGISHKVKVKEGWNVKSNLFTVIVGRPGDSKSHALNFCFKPIHIRESELFYRYEQEVLNYEDSLESGQKKLKKPFLEKFLISDYTLEALILSHFYNKRGLYIYVDELHGWIKNFNRYNNSGEAEIYLSLWSGTTISTDRASGKNLRIEDPFVGVIGSTQIAVLKEFAKEGRSANGFMDRLLFAYPENQKTIKWNIDKVDENILQNYFTIISNLIDLKNNENGQANIIPIEESAEKHLFNWQNNRPDEYLFDYERSIEVKLQEYVIRFALILQLIHYASDKKTKNEVQLFAVKGAIRLFEYFYHNAIKVRSEITKKNYLESLTELQKIILAELPKNFTTQAGLKIACKKVDGKPRISERQFKTYLNDRKLFKRVSHGNYEKIL